MKLKNLTWISLVLLLAVTCHAQRKTYVQLSLQPESKLWLDGNSTLHEFEAKTSEFSATIISDSLLFTEQLVDHPFRQATITIPVKNLHSGNGDLDDNMYDALNAGDHPNIVFTMTADSIISKPGNDSITINTTGTLSVSGKSRAISMTVTALKRHDNIIVLNGTKELLMTDFGVEPPSMMFGVLKTYNNIVIHFNLFLKPDHTFSQQ